MNAFGMPTLKNCVRLNQSVINVYAFRDANVIVCYVWLIASDLKCDVIMCYVQLITSHMKYDVIRFECGSWFYFLQSLMKCDRDYNNI